MDPKQNSNQPLDPKLQEVYDRVMGTSLGGNPQTVPPAEPTITPLPSPSPIPSTDASPTPPITNSTVPLTPPADAIPAPADPNTITTTLSMTPPQANPPAASPVEQLPTMESPKETAPTPPMDAVSATISMPQLHHESETVKIGVGGSPISTTHAKGKGISPVILIFGAFAFLLVYGVFWVKFFGFTLPFMPK